jgi:hypothetical protein
VRGCPLSDPAHTRAGRSGVAFMQDTLTGECPY